MPSHPKAAPVLLSLGSNLGDRLAALRAALDGLARFVHVTAVSPVYETTPMYVDDQPAFLNCAATIATSLPPLDLLRAIKVLEARLGRMPARRFGPRAIDIDIVLHGDRVVDGAELVIPHPRMAERPFVLVPAADIAGDWMHPLLGRSVAALRAALGPVDDLVRREDAAA